MKCPKCETVNPTDSKFCKECATPLPPGAKDEVSFTRTLETTTDELTRGTVFAGRYEIIEELGAGGMGRVYRAHDTKLNEEVALKLIKPEIAAEKRVVERFRNELRTARKIRHKNVCGMYDFHEEGKTLYLTMEYVRGEDLKSLIHRTKTLSIGTALSIAHQVAEGLGEAHKLGITHRDLKPGNIMIDKDGQAKIMDFGIARVRQEKGITGEGAVIGTPEYMSPEQVEGKEADQRADLYALGVILFEMVTGRVPFEGETPLSVAHKHRYEEPPVPKKLAPQVPEGLNKLILRCLEKDKAKRYQTAEELIADLAGVEDSLPTTERVAPKRKTTTHREVTVKFQPRKLVIPAAAILVLAVGGFFLWTKVLHRAGPALPSAKPTIAVLYLKNASGDPTLDKWKENLPTLLAAGLAQSRYLRVIDDSTVYGILKKLDLLKSEKYTPEELKTVAAEGGATHLLSGNYFTAGSKFIINLSLVDANTGTALKPLEEEAPNQEAIFDSVDSLAKKIKVALNIPEQLIDEGTYKMVGEVYTKNPQALQYYIEGEKGHQVADYGKAVPAFENAVQLDPGFAAAYRMLGVCYGNLQNFVKQYQNVHKAYELREKLPEKDRLLIEGSWFALREETWPKAYPTFKKAVERYPDDFQARWSMAFFAADPDESIREMEYLLRSQTQIKSNLLYWSLAMRYCWKEDYKRAREYLEERIKVLAPNPWLHLELAGVFQLEKNLDAARQECEKAVALAPKELWIKAQFTNIDWIKEDPDKALATLGNLLKGQKDPSMLDDWRFFFFMIKGKFKEVLDFDNKAEKTATSAGGGNVQLGQMLVLKGKDLLQTGNPEEALEKFRASLAYIKKEEDNFPEKDIENLIHNRRVSLIWQICALSDMGRVGDAEALYREYEPLIPKYNRKKGQKVCICSNAALPAGKIALAKRDAAEAIKQLEESLRGMEGEDFQNNSEHAYILDALGDAYQMGGRMDKAAETYARIRELQNGRGDWGAVYARSYYKLGKVYEQMGKKAVAREKYFKFLDLWKDADSGLPEVVDAKKRLAAL
jgi:serine/threonine protein kinase/tetratricopeptide (TPR) repeat protein